jgi:tetratricopeptide (TPR) repeat protein
MADNFFLVRPGLHPRPLSPGRSALSLRSRPRGVGVASRLGLAAWLGSAVLFAQTPAQHDHPTAGKLGSVHFQTSCTAAAQAPFDHAMALLHSFEFGPAIDGFNATLAADPSCGIAWWGIAMSRWGNPFGAGLRQGPQLAQGLDAARRAQQVGAKTERERGFVGAVSTLYTNYETLDQRTRQVAYCDAMAKVASSYPDDHEATIFYALSLVASAPPTDKTYANQLKAGAMLEKILPAEPDHPGITHYIIHSYDVPALADRAMAAAHRYADIAPDAPHALHMPSHTFTRVGAWQESIDTNIRSAATARTAGMTAEELHATDYMMYAYLQTGQDAAAERVLKSLPQIATRFDVNATGSAAPGVAGVWAFAAIPARWALERRDWNAAAALAPKTSAFPYTEAMTHLARALGAAHTGALADARTSVAALQMLQEKLVAGKETYWAEQVAIQHEEAAAFVALAEGHADQAVNQLRAAAAREDATEKNAITPGPLAPARELLGDMLLELKQPAAALAEYQAVLKKEPRRFRAVYGVAHAAQLSGDAATSRKAFADLVAICERADNPGRPELVEARKAAAR